MTSSELFDKIQNSSIDDHRTTGSVLCQALENMIGLERRIEKLEAQLKTAARTAARADHVASCLANGIQPD